MDISARKAAADNIFGEMTVEDDAPVGANRQDTRGDTTKTKLWRLEKMYEKELRKWWEATSLQKYLDVKRIPRGLRIFTIPSYENPNPDMLRDWAQHSAVSSEGMLKILIHYAWLDREELLKQIEILEQELKSSGVEKQLDEFKQQMTQRLDKIEEVIKRRKVSKFQRDREDYASGRILTFAKKFDSARRDVFKEKNSKKPPITVDTDISSDTDISEDEQSGASGSASGMASGSEKEMIRTDFLDEYRVMRGLQQRPPRRNLARKGNDERTGGERQGDQGKDARGEEPNLRETRSQRGKSMKK